MNNEEKILEHLALSSKPEADKRDKRAKMDANTIQYIRLLTDRIDAMKEQTRNQNDQVASLQELLRKRNAEYQLLYNAFYGTTETTPES